MSNSQINGYEIECSGELLDASGTWAAYLALFLPSSNQMHMNNIFPRQRVLVGFSYPNKIAAEDAAYKVALEIIDSPVSKS